MTEYAVQCAGPGPHEPPDGVLGTADSPDVTGLCTLCAALEPTEPDRPPLEREQEPETSPRDLTPVRERII